LPLRFPDEVVNLEVTAIFECAPGLFGDVLQKKDMMKRRLGDYKIELLRWQF